ncbi:hypothetical protein GGR52DRAFT_216181 [Hypoxylon sp. FL1284]|nr:hypothetical protein GGR52DRAFT_216181 [Hypoxylon sp. FL1284]
MDPSSFNWEEPEMPLFALGPPVEGYGSADAPAEEDYPPEDYHHQQGVNLSELQVEQKAEGGLWSPQSEFYQSQAESFSSYLATNYPPSSSQGGTATYPGSSTYDLPEQNNDDESMFGPPEQISKKKHGKTVTLNEFWCEAGADWSKVRPPNGVVQGNGQRKIGMAGLQTRLECSTCGTPLEITKPHDEKSIVAEVISTGGCKVCGCFN